jgi:hypothetical protein
MAAKTEERIKKMLEDHMDNQITIVNDRIGGVFVYGFIAGVIMSYSGFLSYFAGIGTGIAIANKYKFISNQISEKMTYIFDNFLKNVQKNENN